MPWTYIICSHVHPLYSVLTSLYSCPVGHSFYVSLWEHKVFSHFLLFSLHCSSGWTLFLSVTLSIGATSMRVGGGHQGRMKLLWRIGGSIPLKKARLCSRSRTLNSTDCGERHNRAVVIGLLFPPTAYWTTQTNHRPLPHTTGQNEQQEPPCYSSTELLKPTTQRTES